MLCNDLVRTMYGQFSPLLNGSIKPLFSSLVNFPVPPMLGSRNGVFHFMESSKNIAKKA